MKTENEIPRRIRIDLNMPAELAIRDAIREVEIMGANETLTSAVMLLIQAKDLVADYIDEFVDNSGNPKR